MAVYNDTTLATLTLETRIERAAATLPQTTQTPYFSVYGGRCLVTLLLGEVTTIVQAQACAASWEADPTVGTTNAMCATFDVNGAEAGTLLTVIGPVATAMTAGKSGAVQGPSSPIVVAVGDLEFKTAANNTGATKWSLWYVPLDDGAYILAV